jgi:SAM-dependent methyltransferase
MPTEEELRAYYENKYYLTLGNNHTMSDKSNDPDGFYAIQYEDRLRSIMKFISPSLPASVLDVGAGYGDFLRFMAEKGWKTQGVEPSKQAYELIHDREALGIKHGSIDNPASLNFTPASVITFNNVLEHLREPGKILKLVQDKFLISGGIIVVIIPNDFNVLQDILMKTVLKNNIEKHYYWISPPDHLNYWSVKMFKKFAGDCGFKILHCITDFPMELFPLMGEDYITHPEVGRNAHLKRVNLEKHFYQTQSHLAKDLLFKSFAQNGIGRDMQFIITPR